ncbi:hypothetical protein Taro_001486 [Colocasia esculenta]|uniref:Pollen Ole e 1 allergen and extensin family protein n=1 Tax=Colocasia esculenta TaxID=4460 RepID=A0A843TA82_COLES|nr:hypothetical protein [Colocasia esculenta]
MGVGAAAGGEGAGEGGFGHRRDSPWGVGAAAGAPGVARGVAYHRWSRCRWTGSSAGVVYCQSCERVGTWSLTGAKPLPSAKVSVSCIDNKNRVRFYESFQTDGNGYFYAPLQGLDLKGSPAALQPLRACKVRLVSSADPKCNLLTNVNYGIAGAPLREANETSYEVVLYSAGPLAFRPAYCPLKPHY